nr:hypothetical protein [Tanacetum cinerariifolium]
MHKAFPLLTIKFLLPEQLPTAREFRIQQYLQHEHYALWEVIEFDDSYAVPINDPNITTTTSGDAGTKSGRTVTFTTEDMQRKKNDVKARTTLLLSLPDEHQLRFSKYKTVRELWAAILKTFGGNEPTKKRKKNLLKQQYRNFKAEGSESLEQTFNRLQDINQIDEDDIEEMDIKWNMALLREDHALVADGEAPKEFALMANTSTESKIFDNSLCSKECKKNNDSLNSKITDLTDKLFDANNFIYHYKLAFTQVESRFYRESNRECIETLSKKLETLKLEKDRVDGKLTGLLTSLKDLDNLIESQRSEKNKEGLGYTVVPPPTAQLYLSPKKDLSWTGLLECADDTVTDYSRPSPTVESTSEDDQNRNSSASEDVASPITPKPFVKFVKPKDCQSENKIDKKETPKKPPVKYAEQYRKTYKKPSVKGNQRN